MKEKQSFLIFFLVSFFFLGCFSTIFQTVLIREFFSVFFGNELCIGIILCIWFLSISIGSIVYVLTENKIKNNIFFYFLILLPLISIFQIYFIRNIRYFLNVPYGMYIPFIKMILAIFIIFPFSFIIGFLFPWGCKLFYSFTSSNLTIGSIYIIESTGSLLGGLFFSFYLANNFNPFSIIFCMFFISLIIVFVVWNSPSTPLSWLPRLGARLGAVQIFVIAALFIFVFPVSKRINQTTIKNRWEVERREVEFIDTIDTKYQNFTLGKNLDQYSLYSNNLYVLSFPDRYREKIIANLIMTQNQSPSKVLIIGEESIGTITKMLNYEVFIDYVILDNKLIKFLYPYLNNEDIETLNNKNIRIIYEDGRFFVKNTKIKYDVVYLSLPDPSTAMLNRYYTFEFFKEVKNILNQDGVLSLHLTSGESYVGSDLLDYNSSIYYTLKRVFPYVVFSPGDVNYYFAGSSKNSVTDDIKILNERYAESIVDAKSIVDVKHNTDKFHYFNIAFYPERINYLKQIFSRQKEIINTDLKPISYFLNFLIWDKESGSGLNKIFKFLKNLNFKFIIYTAVFLFVLRIIYIKSIPQRFNYIFTIFTIGLTSIGLEIILLFSYQNLFGYLYQMLGCLIALFMFGLSIGALSINFLISKNKYNVFILIIIQLVFALLSLILPLILNSISSQLIFAFIIFIIGVFSGAIFPLAGILYLRNKPELSKVASLLNFSDHIGASIGSLIFGVIFIPVFGIAHSCILIFLINVLSILISVFTFKI